MKERDVQKAILDYLAAKGILAFRMNSGATLSSYKGKTRMVRYGTPGMADVLAFPFKPERAYLRDNLPFEYGGTIFKTIVPTWIEVKAPKGKQSELQKSFQAQVEAHGHRYILASSLDAVIEVLK